MVPCEKSDPMCFEEMLIDGQIFCIIPRFLVKYVPTSLVADHYLDGVGPVQVGEKFAYIPIDQMTELTKTISLSTDLQAEVKRCRDFLWSRYGQNDQLPPFDPESLRLACISAGANKLFATILNAMSSEDTSAQRQALNEKKAVTIIYMRMFGQSQKANWFQKVISNIAVGKGISEGGLSVLNKSGITVSKSTQRREFLKVADSHESVVQDFIADAINKKALLALMIDDFTNIHTKKRPTDQATSSARSMATIIHDYQQHQTGVQAMRKMDGCKLIDELELPLKGFNDFYKAAHHAVSKGLGLYLSKFICPQPGDWPAQFYMRQVQLHDKESIGCVPFKHIVPFIGPLRIQLNARECVSLLNIEFFKKAYSYIFGSKRVLASKPQAWRISFLLEVLYGGWTLIRDQVTVAFSNCKDLQYLTLLNLIDNYLPLVLSIYSIIFKSGNTEMFATPHQNTVYCAVNTKDCSYF